MQLEVEYQRTNVNYKHLQGQLYNQLYKFKDMVSNNRQMSKTIVFDAEQTLNFSEREINVRKLIIN